MNTPTAPAPKSAPTADSAASDVMVSVRNLTKIYPTRHGEVHALKDVSVEVKRGEVLVLLGPSGCGKTTLLRSVAGLEQPTTGEIEVHGRTVFSSSQEILVPPEKRNLAMVFQSYALWPHMTVADNVGYPLKVSKVAQAEIRERVQKVLSLTGLDKLAGNYPGQLSGGQQQRVALARALVANDGLILFDEPLSNLDAKVRERLRDELVEMQQEFGFTSIYVTHDQIEAAALADRIAVMEYGRVAQLGSPVEIFNTPEDPFIADFVGFSNVLEGVVTETGPQGVTVDTPIGPVEARAQADKGQRIKLMFRPEHTAIGAAGATGANTFEATVERTIFLGSHIEVILEVAGHRLATRSMKGEAMAPGEKASITIDAPRLRLFPAE